MLDKMLERMTPEGREWFANRFPNKATLAQVWADCPYWEWRVELAVYAAEQPLTLAFVQDCIQRAAAYAVAANKAANEATASLNSIAARYFGGDGVDTDSYVKAVDATAGIVAASRAASQAVLDARAAADVAITDTSAANAAVLYCRDVTVFADRATYAGYAEEEQRIQLEWARHILLAERN